MKSVSAVTASLAILCLMSAAAIKAEDVPQSPGIGDAKFFEMRIYTTHPGKLDALHQRFRDHTNRLFQKHGMTLVGYWTPAEGAEMENTLVYILAYPNRDSRERSWQAFRDDPEWKKAFAESHKDGPIVMKVESKFLTPTDYSPIK